MRVTVFEPSARLRPYVRSMSVVETDEAEASAVLPQPGLLLGVRYAGSAELLTVEGARPIPNSSLVGVRNTLRRLYTSAKGGIVVAAFTELGAAQFFDEPLHEFFGQMVALESVWARAELAALEERLAEARSNVARVRVLEEALWGRRKAGAPDPLVSAALRVIKHQNGQLRIDALAKELGISQDPLEKRFRRAVGASPKQLAKLFRFLSVVGGYAAGRTLTELAHDAGYYDQSHLIREFRAVTGEPPERFLKAQAHC